MEQQKIPSIKVIKGKTSPYESKGILRYNHYWLDPKLDMGIVAVRGISCLFHYCITVLSIYWYSKIKE